MPSIDDTLPVVSTTHPGVIATLRTAVAHPNLANSLINTGLGKPGYQLRNMRFMIIQLSYVLKPISVCDPD